jgi:hypothetical protein
MRAVRCEAGRGRKLTPAGRLQPFIGVSPRRSEDLKSLIDSVHQPYSLLRPASCANRATRSFCGVQWHLRRKWPGRRGPLRPRPLLQARDVARSSVWILTEKFQVLMAVRRALSNKKTARRRSSCSADEAEIRPRERPRPPILSPSLLDQFTRCWLVGGVKRPVRREKPNERCPNDTIKESRPFIPVKDRGVSFGSAGSGTLGSRINDESDQRGH